MFNLINSKNLIQVIIYKSFIDLNKYLDPDNIYNYLKNIKENINEFLDFLYEKNLTDYMLSEEYLNNISELNSYIEKETINIANKILQEK
jgi:hypothetical protein